MLSNKFMGLNPHERWGSQRRLDLDPKVISDFNFGDTQPFGPVSLKSIVKRTIEVLNPIFRQCEVLEVRDHGVEMFARGSECMLQQILITLVHNAYRVFGYGARKITVFIHGIQRESDESLVPGSVTRTKYVGFTVADNAEGLSEVKLSRLSDPRLVPQPADEGFGLFMVKCLVSAHGGALVVTTGRGCGTRFTVYLPASAA